MIDSSMGFLPWRHLYCFCLYGGQQLIKYIKKISSTIEPKRDLAFNRKNWFCIKIQIADPQPNKEYKLSSPAFMHPSKTEFNGHIRSRWVFEAKIKDKRKWGKAVTWLLSSTYSNHWPFDKTNCRGCNLWARVNTTNLIGIIDQDYFRLFFDVKKTQATKKKPERKKNWGFFEEETLQPEGFRKN